MTIDEAVEMRREQAQAIIDAIEKTENEHGIQYEIRSTDKFGFGLAEPYEVAAAYLHLTDPTPLTRELIEAELGKPCEAKSDGVAVAWSGHSLYLGVDGSFCLNYRRIANKTTLGQLRQLVAILRGGRA